MKNKSVLVTIGIPFYKDKDTLEDAVMSVLNQTYDNWELFLVDDNGNDGSLEIARRFENDKRIQVVSDGCNKGLQKRLNEMIRMANGKYFARMDADDIMCKDRIEEQVNYMEKNEDIDVLGTGAYSMDVNGNILGIKKEKGNQFNSEYCLKKTPVMHPTVMAKTSWYKRNNYSEELAFKRAEDLELWARTYPWTNFANLEKPLLYYREGNSIKKDVNSQLMTYNAALEVIKRYSVGRIDSKCKMKLMIIVYMKKYIYLLMCYLGMMDWFASVLIKKRYKNIR